MSEPNRKGTPNGINNTNHFFSTQEATKYGIPKAILLSAMRIWTDAATVAGKEWVTVTMARLEWAFPYMSRATSKRALDELVSDGLIEANPDNTHGRTGQYRMPIQLSQNETVYGSTVSKRDSSEDSLLFIRLLYIYKILYTGARARTGLSGVEREKYEALEDALMRVPEDARQAFAEWIEYRRANRYPVSTDLLRRQAEFLASQPDALECIRQSMRNGWRGLFEAKKNDKINLTLPNKPTILR